MISIRRLEASDLARIAEIQAASLEAAGWQVEEYLERESWVVIADGAVAGFAIARATAPGVEYELLNMAIAPESRQRGLGRALLVQVMEQFKGHWFLEVRESNAKARRLYEGVGFAVTRRRKNYYSAPLEDGLEMSKHS